MTEQEFDQQVWRRFDVVTTDTGIVTTVMNVCFTTRSVRIFVKNAPPEWLPCNRIVSHKTHKGNNADDITIIEELHNRVLKQNEEIERLKSERQLLNEKISKNFLKDLLAAVNALQMGLTEKKHKIQMIDNAIAQIESITANGQCAQQSQL